MESQSLSEFLNYALNATEFDEPVHLPSFCNKKHTYVAELTAPVSCRILQKRINELCLQSYYFSKEKQYTKPKSEKAIELKAEIVIGNNTVNYLSQIQTFLLYESIAKKINTFSTKNTIDLVQGWRIVLVNGSRRKHDRENAAAVEFLDYIGLPVPAIAA